MILMFIKHVYFFMMNCLFIPWSHFQYLEFQMIYRRLKTVIFPPYMCYKTFQTLKTNLK